MTSYSKCVKKNVGGDENSQLKRVISFNTFDVDQKRGGIMKEIGAQN